MFIHISIFNVIPLLYDVYDVCVCVSIHIGILHTSIRVIGPQEDECNYSIRFNWSYYGAFYLFLCKGTIYFNMEVRFNYGPLVNYLYFFFFLLSCRKDCFNFFEVVSIYIINFKATLSLFLVDFFYFSSHFEIKLYLVEFFLFFFNLTKG